MALNGKGPAGSSRALARMVDGAAASSVLTVVARLSTAAVMVLFLALSGFFGPKIWDFAADLAEQQSRMVLALERVTWRLDSNGAHDARQDRHLEFIDQRIDRLDRGRSTRMPAWPPAESEQP